MDSFFFWNFLILRKYRNSISFIKSGVKYGGNYIIYYGELSYFNHIHSKSILITENSNLKESSCTQCSFKQITDWKNFQNKIRLAQQVSKKINLIDFYAKKKKWALIEMNLQRFLFK